MWIWALGSGASAVPATGSSTCAPASVTGIAPGDADPVPPDVVFLLATTGCGFPGFQLVSELGDVRGGAVEGLAGGWVVRPEPPLTPGEWTASTGDYEGMGAVELGTYTVEEGAVLAPPAEPDAVELVAERACSGGVLTTEVALDLEFPDGGGVGTVDVRISTEEGEVAVFEVVPLGRVAFGTSVAGGTELCVALTGRDLDGAAVWSRDACADPAEACPGDGLRDDPGGCGCASSPVPGGVALFGALGLVARRRRARP
jgi:MYXO-CTERM domain-containing protein